MGRNICLWQMHDINPGRNLMYSYFEMCLDPFWQVCGMSQIKLYNIYQQKVEYLFVADK